MLKKVGTIGVDAGLVWIGDPCYILHKEDNDQPESIGKDWSEFCDKIGGNESVSFPFNLGHEGLGVCVHTLHGDGSYDVMAEVDGNGRISKISIDFDN